MSTEFGPQLIGEAEKTLSALLRAALEATNLTERQWVGLRLADQVGAGDASSLAAAIAARAHFTETQAIVDGLTELGLVDAGELTPEGRAMLETAQDRIGAMTAGVWNGLDPTDVAATARVLQEIVRRGRQALEARPGLTTAGSLPLS